MHAELVGSARDRLQLQTRPPPLGRGRCREQPPPCRRGPSEDRIDAGSRRPLRIRRQRQVHDSFGVNRPPCTIASYRFCTIRASNARPSAARAWLERASTRRPDVSRSSRCTASSSPNAARICDATQGGSSDVRAGTLGMPAGLSTTIRSASAKMMRTQPPAGRASSREGVASRHGDGCRGACESGSVTTVPAPRPTQPAWRPAPRLPASSAACLPRSPMIPVAVGQPPHGETVAQPQRHRPPCRKHPPRPAWLSGLHRSLTRERRIDEGHTPRDGAKRLSHQPRKRGPCPAARHGDPRRIDGPLGRKGCQGTLDATDILAAPPLRIG